MGKWEAISFWMGYDNLEYTDISISARKLLASIRHSQGPLKRCLTSDLPCIHKERWPICISWHHFHHKSGQTSLSMYDIHLHLKYIISWFTLCWSPSTCLRHSRWYQNTECLWRWRVHFPMLYSHCCLRNLVHESLWFHWAETGSFMYK